VVVIKDADADAVADALKGVDAHVLSVGASHHWE
jgi:hypothetical protein